VTKFMSNKDGTTFYLKGNVVQARRMAQTESSTLSFRLPDAAAGDRPRYAGINVERPLSLAIAAFDRSDLLDALAQRCAIRTTTAVAIQRTRDTDQPAGASDAKATLGHHVDFQECYIG
jgi:hypothetical protein